MGIKGGVAGRVNSWMAKPAEAEKTTPAAPAASPAKPAVRLINPHLVQTHIHYCELDTSVT